MPPSKTSPAQLAVGTGIVALTLIALWLFVPLRVRMQTWTPDLPGKPLRDALEARYGKAKYSMGPEELILREILQDRRGGVFVDVGAADARILSNTYLWESEYGWRGYAIEPQLHFQPDYARFRPQTKFLPFFVSSKSDATILFYIAGRPYSSSADKKLAAQYTKPGETLKETTVSTITLDDLLTKEAVPTGFDLLSMDIEHHEPEALKGFTIATWKPGVVVIEVDSHEIRQTITDYFVRNGYTLLTRYIQADLLNFYFVPLPEAR